MEPERKESGIDTQPIPLYPEAYSPSSLISVFNRSFAIREEKRLILFRAIFISNGSKEYGGYFFDKARDAVTKHSLTLKVPALLRSSLSDQKEYVFRGYVDRSVKSDGKIQINFSVTEVVSEEKSVTEDEGAEKRSELLRRKIEAGFRNIDQVVRERLYVGEKPKFALLFGQAAITDKDFFNALGESARFFDLVEHRVNMTHLAGLTRALQELSRDCHDCVALVRGGGSGLELFDDPCLAESAISLPCVLLTAIGHADDRSFLDRVSDRSFDTPTALGAYLHSLVERIEEEKTNSKASLIKQVEETVQQQFKEKIENLERTLKSQTDQHVKAEKEMQELLKCQEDEKKRLFEDRDRLLKVFDEERKRSEAEKREQLVRFDKEKRELTETVNEERKRMEAHKRDLEAAISLANKGLQGRLLIPALTALLALVIGFIAGKIY